MHIRNVIEALDKFSDSDLQRAVELLAQAREEGRSVYIVGNGGSAATASHFANDLLKMAGIKAISIPDMTPMVTAFGNDEGWLNMYSEVVRALADELDVLVAITCSGNSMNVIQAMQAAQDLNMYVILLTGNDETCNAVLTEPDVIIYAEADDIKVQEDVHLVVCHAIAGALC